MNQIHQNFRQDIRHAIVSALKQNLIPGFALQCFALSILLIYFFMPQSQPTFAWFSQRKQEYGALYSVISTALFGGLIPVVYLWLAGRLSTQALGASAIFYTLFWAYKGLEVDFLYRLQAHWFGTGGDWQTVLHKMLADQFGYTTFWSAPSVALIYLWRELGFSFSRARAAVTREFVLVKLPANLLSNWLVWIPAVSLVYTMPSDLQIPMFNLVLCFWVLMLAVLNKPE